MPVGATALDLDPAGGSRAEALVSLVRLRWFINRRWAMLLLLWVFIAVECGLCRRWVRPVGLLWPLLALLLVNLFWLQVSRTLQQRIASSGEHDVGVIRLATWQANAQIAIDLLLLTAIIHYTGGTENPMAIFYLFHMAIASLLLPSTEAILQGVWAFLLYGLLGIAELLKWLPHFELLPNILTPRLYLQPQYVMVVLIVVGSAVFGSLYFTLRIAARMQEREQALRTLNWALQRSQAALQEMQRRKAQFMRTAAHQLKSPLAVIQTQVNLLRDTPMPEEKRRQFYDKVITRCQVAIGQVTDLLTYARVQEGMPDRKALDQSDVLKVVRDLYERHHPVAREKGLELTCDLPHQGRYVVPLSEADLADAIGNLIENAIKYTDCPGRISVGLAQAGEVILVTIRDTGMGMALETQREMFDAYRRGNLALEKGIFGSGLGLSIVRAIMEQVGGEIVVRSRPNEGSSFTLRLPTKAPEPEAFALEGTSLNVIRIE